MEPLDKASQLIKTRPKLSDKKHGWPETPESTTFKTLEASSFKNNYSNNSWPALPISLSNKT